MRILLVQHDPAGGEPERERVRLRERLDAELPRPGDLVLLPELATTGFQPGMADSLELRESAKKDLAFYADQAKRRESWVLAGILDASEGPGKWRNLAVLFDPTGAEAGRYEKIHPFSFSGEHEAFPGGETTTVWEVDGWRLQPAVCYDLRFPELFRARLGDGVNAFAVIANWPESRRRHWETLLSARAIENQAFLFAVNTTGTAFGTRYFGGSRVVNPKGETMLTADGDPGIYAVNAYPDEAAKWREAFPALMDRKRGGFYA
ncbi:MAG: carbon-nitrogen family hydrolase [Spirochaetes bacterium]|nr:carbon-nitrogen family hydrolase [Spirochaetota bacterium]